MFKTEYITASVKFYNKAGILAPQRSTVLDRIEDERFRSYHNKGQWEDLNPLHCGNDPSVYTELSEKEGFAAAD